MNNSVLFSDIKNWIVLYKKNRIIHIKKYGQFLHIKIRILDIRKSFIDIKKSLEMFDIKKSASLR